MQFSAITLLALAGSALATYTNGTVYVTEVVTALTTVCPLATELTYGGSTYTVTASQTLTITHCPGGCTIVKPITTSTSVICNSCAPVSSAPVSSAPVAPVYGNSTIPAVATTPAATTPGASKTAVGTTSAKSSSTAAPSNISSSGATKVAMSGSLAGLIGLAAYFL